MKVSKNFYAWEFVPPEIHKKYGNSDAILWFISPFMVNFAQFMRERLDSPIYINTYNLKNPSILGSVFTQSGLRLPGSSTGAPWSQHRFKCAVDLKIPGKNIDEIIDDIDKNFEMYNRETGITTVELGTKTWLHADCRNTGLKELFKVGFYKKGK